MWKTLSKYTAAFDYVDKTLFVLPHANSGVYVAFYLILLEYFFSGIFNPQPPG